MFPERWGQLEVEIGSVFFVNLRLWLADPVNAG